MEILYQFRKYLALRFPLVPLFIFTVLTSLTIYTYSNELSNINISVLAWALIYLQFLFHMRVMDEFKDFEYDNKNFKDRPLQSGIVTKKDILIYGFVNFIIMTLIAFLSLNVFGVALYLTSVVYSFLMYKEFFVNDFWEKSPVLYLISHQLVLVLLYLSYFVSSSPLENITNNLLEFVVYFTFVYIPILLIEFGRKIKFRYDSKGQKTNDTYAFLWGQRNTINLIVSIAVFFSVLLGFFQIAGVLKITVLLAVCLIYYIYSFINFEKFVEKSETLTYLLCLLLLMTLLFV